MREIFLDVDNVEYGLTQACSKLVNEGLDSYIVMGIGNGGAHIVKGLIDCGFSEKALYCSLDDEELLARSFESEELFALNKSDIIDKKILVCEDTTITGKSFEKIYDQLKAIGADDVKLFSFLMRRGSSIVPNIYIFETEKDTKVYFPWSSYPIRTYSKGIVRKIKASDAEKNFECGDARIDKIQLADFYKDYVHHKANVYLVEDNNEICSIIKFSETTHGDYTGLFLDVIATAKDKQGNKYGNTLLKLIINYMFYHEFDFIYGYAFDDVINMYKNINFEIIGSVQVTNYGILHKVATVHTRKKMENNLLIATLKSNI